MSSIIVQFLKPSKGKIICAITLPVLWSLLFLGITYIQQFLIPTSLKNIILVRDPFSIFLWILLESFMYYPFACSLVTIYDFYKKKELSKLFENKYLLLLVIIGLIIFNPIGYVLFFFFIASITPTNEWSCGAYALEIIPGSPAESHIKIGETIIKINERIIHNASDFTDVMNTTKAGEQIDVYLLGGSSFTAHLAQLSSNQTRGFLGVRVRDAVVTATKNPCKPE